MSSHILSDIEALCDNVAILRSGRLVATGRLDDLLATSGEIQLFEINVKSVTADQLSSIPANVPGATVTPRPSGASVQVTGDDDIENVIA